MTKHAVYEKNKLTLNNNELMLDETIFHNANGYIGIRSSFEEGYPAGYQSIRGSYINGFYDFAEMKQAEKLYGFVEEKQTMVNVADTQGIELYLGDERFSMFEGEVLSVARYLDMDKGITAREIHWRSPKGAEVLITSKRMTSFTLPNLFTIEYCVRALNFEGQIRILSTHEGDVENYSNPEDPRVAGESFCHLHPVDAEIRERTSLLETRTAKSNLHVCTAVTHRLNKITKDQDTVSFTESPKCESNGHHVSNEWEINIRKHETLELVKYTIFTDSVRCVDVKEEAFALMNWATSKPLSYWYRKQEEYLSTYWDHAYLEIEGDEALAISVKYNLYQLLQSAGKDKNCNIAAKGLSGEGYEGHYFWDTEMYIQPFFVLTNQSLAKTLLSYRYEILPYARENARIMGHKKGALYPWRTIMGKECSGYYPSGTAQYHINGDIAHAVVAYWLAAGDMDFMEDMGAEILIETARLWMDVGHFSGDDFVIMDVTGPDEYTCMVNNNYFTNVSAQYNLHWAVKAYGLLKNAGRLKKLREKLKICDEEIAEFEEAGSKMRLLYDERLGINPQDDSFLEKPVWDIENTPKENFPLLLHYHPLKLYRYQVCKQADTVLSHFIYEDAQSTETTRRSFDYYEKITTHDSSLSTCIFSIVASKLCLYDKAYRYFGDSAKLDLHNTHGNTKDGIHTANMGGTYMAIVYGFGGLRLKEEGLFFAPYLPDQWESYRFKVNYQGRGILVTVKKGSIRFQLLYGEPVGIHVYKRKMLLTDDLLLRPKFKAVIFDLDGVICSTDHYHFLAWKHIADELGIYFDQKINNRLRGVSRSRSFDIILERADFTLTPEEKHHYMEKKNTYYRALLKEMSRDDLCEGAEEILTFLRKFGVKLAIGSSSKNARMILKQLGISDYFDAVSDGTNIIHSKPDPEVFTKAAEYLKLQPEECLVVEDALAGIDAANEGKMKAAAIGDAYGYEKADIQLRTLMDLQGLIC